MIIKKLNALFYKHSRVLFGVFTLLIILAFTDFLTPGNMSGCSDSGSSVVGSAFGEKITMSELQNFSRDLSLASMVSGMQFNANDINSLFQMYCMLKRAEQLGIQVTDKEVAEMVVQRFSVSGKFSKEDYDKFLKNSRLTDNDVASGIRLILTMQKLQNSVMSGIQVTDSEVEKIFKLENAGFVLNICNFEAENYSAGKIEDSAVEAFYNANKSKYILPGNFDVMYVSIPYETFAAEAEKTITPADINQLKKENPAPEAELKKSLVQMKSMELAMNKVNAVTGELYSKLNIPVNEQPAVFAKWAADNNLVLSELNKVPFNSQMLDKEYLPGLCRELQGMGRNGVQLARPARGTNAYVIALLKERIEPKQQTFASVKAAVTKDCEFAEKLKRVRAVAANQVKIVRENKDAASRMKSFAALKGTHKKLTLPLPEKTASGNVDVEALTLSYRVRPAIVNLLAGEVSDVIATETGAMIVLVEKRIPADMKKFAGEKEGLKANLRMMKMQLALQDFSNEMMRQCTLTIDQNR